MRVCLISREFVPFLGWGAGTYASLMAAAWAKAGHETHVLTAESRAVTEGPRLCPGVTFHAVDYCSEPMSLGGWPCPELRHSMGVYRALSRLHATYGFDYLEFPDFDGEAFFSLRARQTLGAFAGAAIGIRMHSTTQDIRSLNADVWLDRSLATVAYMEDECIRGADLLLPCSRAMGELVKARLGDSAARAFTRSFPTPNPFDFDLLKELNAGERHDERNELLFIGRLERRKGVHVLIDATQRLFDAGADFTVRLIGGDTNTSPFADSMHAHLLSRIQPKHKHRFIFEVGQHPRSALGPAIRRARVCCFPSLWENFPYALLEAMALGAAVIGSDAGGMADIIQEGETGLLFRAGDAASLADTIKLAMTDQPLRDRLRAGAPGRVRELCDPNAVAAQIVEHVKTVRALCSPSLMGARAGGRVGSHEARQPHALPDSHPMPVPLPEGGARGGLHSREGPSPHGPPVNHADVAVIIPVFNLHQHLDETIASVRAQTIPVREIILIDDGSTHAETVAALDNLARSGCRLIRQENLGLSGARNAGIAATNARFVLPLDADDLIDSRFVEGCMGALERDPGLAYVTTLLATFAESPNHCDGVYVPLGQPTDMLPVYNVAGCCTGIFDRAALLAVGGYSTQMPAYEDWDLYCALTAAGKRGAIIPEFWVINRVRQESMLRRMSRRRHEYLRARIMQRHPTLSVQPDRTLRLLLSEFVHLPSADEMLDPASIARRMINENIRYRVVDRLNEALKETPLHAALKSWTRRALEK